MSGRNIALDRTRTALTVLVVIHHAIIPYTYYGHADAQTWLGFDGVVLANDSFFMAAFFFLSGLFVWPSLRRKSTSQFLGDRALRLALPFTVAALVLMPLAYYALELRRPDHLGFGAFWWQTVTVGPWPSGPVWFVWVLLAFDVLAATIYRIAPESPAPINRLSLSGYTRPLVFFIAFAAVTTLAYVPMRLHFGVSKWFEFGPLSVQASRVLLYAACFMFGAGVGYAHSERGLLGEGNALSRQWGRWALAALAAYGVIVALVYDRRAILPDPNMLPQWWEVTYAFAFPLFSAAMTFAVLAWFMRRENSRAPLLDAMQSSAYGIFLIHYVPVLWMQHWLLGQDLSAFGKAALSLIFGLGVSWLATLALRSLPGAKRVL